MEQNICKMGAAVESFWLTTCSGVDLTRILGGKSAKEWARECETFTAWVRARLRARENFVFLDGAIFRPFSGQMANETEQWAVGILCSGAPQFQSAKHEFHDKGGQKTRGTVDTVSPTLREWGGGSRSFHSFRGRCKSVNDGPCVWEAFTSWGAGPIKGPGKFCILDALWCNLGPILRGDIWYCVPHPPKGGGTCPPVPPPDWRPWGRGTINPMS